MDGKRRGRMKIVLNSLEPFDSVEMNQKYKDRLPLWDYSSATLLLSPLDTLMIIDALKRSVPIERFLGDMKGGGDK